MAEVTVRHDAEIEITFHVASGVVAPGDRKQVTTANLLNAALTVGSAMYVGNSSVRHGSASYSLRLVNPKRDTLKEGERCTCDECERGVYD